ncbi:ABC transporter permease [Candidatus Berkelbacteria bacterium]|nr:ABC transporter permease [Candidatus Berkelbacteria bacterium]
MSSKSKTFWRVAKLGHQNFWRNRWLTLGATLLMTLTLTMISVSLLMTFILRDTAESIRSKIDITIYFRNDAIKDEQIQQLAEKIKQVNGVIAVDFIDKSEALAIFKRLPINDNIKSPIDEKNNPLPRSVLVDTQNPDDIQAVVNNIDSIDSNDYICSECVSYDQNKEKVDKVISATQFVQLIGIGLSVFFGVIAIFNVYNIIKITITARSDEIEIMRVVGASNMFVRGPFIVEGILYGLIGTIFTTSFLLLMAKLSFGGGSTTNSSGFSISNLLGIDIYTYLVTHIWQLVAVQFLAGSVLGVVVSLISIRKFLKS